MEDSEEGKKLKSKINEVKRQIHIIERQYKGYESVIRELIVLDGGENIESLKTGKEETWTALNKLNEEFKRLLVEYEEYKKRETVESNYTEGQSHEAEGDNQIGDDR